MPFAFDSRSNRVRCFVAATIILTISGSGCASGPPVPVVGIWHRRGGEAADIFEFLKNGKGVVTGDSMSWKFTDKEHMTLEDLAHRRHGAIVSVSLLPDGSLSLLPVGGGSIILLDRIH